MATLNQIEKRNLLAGILITSLIALAFQEMVGSVRMSVRDPNYGYSFATLALAAMFFLTSIRFLVGNQLHLISEEIITLPGLAWFYDLTLISLQTLGLVFLGGVCSLQDCLNLKIKISFFHILGIVYALDIIWILGQWLLGKKWAVSKRKFIPWGWFRLNAVLLFLIVITLVFFTRDQAYSNASMGLWLAIQIGAFFYDVFLLDYHDVI